jgi:DNA repair exonuclease SbcCD nuclease subunit
MWENKMRLICTADWHIRKTVPICRLETEDEFFHFQFKLLIEIGKIAKKHNVDALIIAGDIFNKSNPGMRLINRISNLLQLFNFPTYACAGNHDLPYHLWNLVHDSGIGILLIDKIINKNMYRGIHINHWGCTNYDSSTDSNAVVVCHHLVFENEKPPNFNALTAKELFCLYPNAKWIICGDNHTGFYHKKNGRHIIVPGNIYIDDIEQLNYKPRVWLIDTEKNIVESIELSNPTEMLSVDYVKFMKEKKEKDLERIERINFFIDAIKSRGPVNLSFKNRIRKTLKTDLSESVRKILIELQEEIE